VTNGNIDRFYIVLSPQYVANHLTVIGQGSMAARRVPGCPASPVNLVLAQPMVGTSNKTPKWLAIPNRLGCAIPCPSQTIKSGEMFNFLMLWQWEGFP
jgi:hypothetical protein